MEAEAAKEELKTKEEERKQDIAAKTKNSLQRLLQSRKKEGSKAIDADKVESGEQEK